MKTAFVDRNGTVPIRVADIPGVSFEFSRAAGDSMMLDDGQVVGRFAGILDPSGGTLQHSTCSVEWTVTANRSLLLIENGTVASTPVTEAGDWSFIIEITHGEVASVRSNERKKMFGGLVSKSVSLAIEGYEATMELAYDITNPTSPAKLKNCKRAFDLAVRSVAASRGGIRTNPGEGHPRSRRRLLMCRARHQKARVWPGSQREPGPTSERLVSSSRGHLRQEGRPCARYVRFVCGTGG